MTVPARTLRRPRAPGLARRDPARAQGTRVILGILPFLIMAGVASVDILAGPTIGFLPVLSLGPALAAVSRRPLQTGMIGGLALVLCVLLGLYDQSLIHRHGIIALATVAGVTGAGVIASAARHRWERELADVRTVAEVAQRVLLRQVPDEVSQVRVAVRYISATAAAKIGGDLYEVMAARDSVRLIVGDVQGKGLAAVQTAATVLGAFREAAYDAPDLTEIAARIETSLGRQAREEEFVTAVLAQIAADGSKVEVLNCGHPPPLLISAASAQFVDIVDPGLPFGLTELAEPTRELTTVAFGPGEGILFYTDGVSEARSRSGAFYALDGCGALLSGHDPDEALERLREDLVRHVGHALEDDAAMLFVCRDTVEA